MKFFKTTTLQTAQLRRMAVQMFPQGGKNNISLGK
jgi:hypothetical protein